MTTATTNLIDIENYPQIREEVKNIPRSRCLTKGVEQKHVEDKN